MITLESAIEIIKKEVSSLPVVFQDSYAAEGYILAEQIKTDIDSPSFNRAVMDGFALKLKDYKKNKWFNIIDDIQAGGEKKRFNNIKDSVVRIMTGASVPGCFDAVIPVEASDEVNNKVKFDLSLITPYTNIAQKGSDCKKNKKLFSIGDKIKITSLPALFYCGKKKLKVYKKPIVNIIITGDELVDVDERPSGSKIRNLNLYILKALCRKHDIYLNRIKVVKDKKEIIEKEIKRCSKRCDLLIITGGVSMGKYDFVDKVLKTDKYKLCFHKIAQRPGKPVIFAKSIKYNNFILGLPGNPLSVLFSFNSIGIPVIKRMSGFKTIGHDFLTGILNKGYQKSNDRMHMIPVKVGFINNNYKLDTYPFFTSGDITQIINTDGFFIGEEKKKIYKKGDRVKFFLF